MGFQSVRIDYRGSEGFRRLKAVKTVGLEANTVSHAPRESRPQVFSCETGIQMHARVYSKVLKLMTEKF